MFQFLLLTIPLILSFGIHAEVKILLPKTPTSFGQAKKLLYDEVYKDHRLTFYCGCEYDDKLRVNLDSCGVIPRKNAKRAKHVEAEHVFPAHQFGNFRKCWREPEKVCNKKMSGRKCCEKADPIFESAHNDLHNLFPAVGEVNGDRSNFNWGMIPGEKRSYGKCNMEVDSSIRRAEPPENVQGDIARVMFYMSHTYGFKLSDQDIQLFTAWNKQDPVDNWEKERNNRIEKIQGNRNPFIDGQVYDPKKIAQFSEEAHVPIEFVPESKEESKEKPKERPANLSTGKSSKSSGESSNSSGKFSCEEKKTCGQMTSCEEAKYHLNTCGDKRLDKDGNGVPCESICK